MDSRGGSTGGMKRKVILIEKPFVGSLGVQPSRQCCHKRTETENSARHASQFTMVEVPSVSEQLTYIKKGFAEIIREEDLKDRLEHCAKAGRPMRIKAGFDP